MGARREIVAMVACAALQAIPLPASTLPSLRIEIPFDGRIQAGDTVPLLVSIEHPGPNLDCSVEASSAYGTLVSKRQVNLPPLSRKQLFLYVQPSRYDSRFEVTLKSAGVPLAKEEVVASPVARERPLCAIVEDRDLGLHRLFHAAVPRAVVVSVPRSHLPDRWFGFESLDLVLWPLASQGPLTTDLLEALRGYVESGGDLLITLGGDPARLGSLRTWLPQGIGPGEEDQDGTVKNDLPPRDGFRRLRHLGQVQAIEKRMGLGRLLVAGFDPAVSGRELALLLKAIVRSEEIDSPGSGGSGGAHGGARGKTHGGTRGGSYFNGSDPILRNYAKDFVESMPGLRPIPLWFLAAFMLLYLLVVGPIDYFVLKRLRRLTWTWITYPLAILVFSTIAYGYAVAVKGTRMVVSSFELIDSNIADPLFRRRLSLTGLFSVSDQVYSLHSSTPSALLNIVTWRLAKGKSGLFEHKGALLQEPSGMVANLPIKVFSMEEVATFSLSRAGQPDLVIEDLGPWKEVAPTVEVRPHGFRNLRVRNRGEQPLLGVTVVGPEFAYVELGTLQPGGVKDVASFGMPKKAPLAPHYPSRMFLGIKRDGPRIIDWDRSLFAKLNILTCRAADRTGFRRDIEEGDHLVLAYRITREPCEIRINGASKAGDRIVLFRSVVPTGGSS